MNANWVRLIGIGAILSGLPATPVAGQDEASGRGVEIETILSEIQSGLSLAQARIKDLGMAPLKSVTLTLKTEASRDAGGRFKILIFTFGHDWRQELTQEVTLELTPPPPPPPTMTFAGPRLADHLVEAIVSAAEGVQKAKNASPPLALKSLTVEIGFVVEHSTQADGGIQILPVSAHLGGELARKAIHRIQVVFEGKGK